ncbi:unnamed protein product [Cuscuta epithymum]|uniref:SWIM-type domain-containing protein n=1 Tax=Cuscuta epithymum TaxID=186058 RepID=A0AAV0EGU4_9ASTE|nr:unnamed protein product [Cuscuta epithymum]
MNNLSEAFNSTIMVARDKPIVTMCEWIRTYLMSRIATLRSKLNMWQHRVMLKPKKRLDREIEHGGNLQPTWATDRTFEVEHTQFVHRFVVDLQKRTCTYNYWQLIGIPCRHAVAGMSYRGLGIQPGE